MRQEVVAEVLDDVPFREHIEVNEYVATKNKIHALHERHTRVIEQIEAVDAAFQRVVHLELVFNGLKIFLPVIRSEVARAVITIKSLVAMNQRTLVEIGRKNLESPALHQPGGFFEQEHAQRIRLLSSRTACAPDFELTNRQDALCFDNFRQHHLA